ncbi:hypothetical protein K435DRAFT_775996, partial [Dendrothele bispora CBS 962.96]
MKIPITQLKNTSSNSSCLCSLSNSFPFCSDATDSTLVILNKLNTLWSRRGLLAKGTRNLYKC